MRRTKRTRLLLLTAGGVVLAAACFFVWPLIAWVVVVLTIVVDLAIWSNIAVAQLVSRIRFGARMNLDEILTVHDRIRMLRLIRYHLGWSPGKIAAELNRLGVQNGGAPWQEHEVRNAVGRSDGSL